MTEQMTTVDKKSPTKATFVKCEDCAMQPLCVPVKLCNGSFSLMDNYLSKRNAISNSHSLFTENEPLSAIYAVCSGSFKLTEAKEDGSEKVIGFRFPGELIGEDAIHTQEYRYNAISVGNSSFCKINVKELLACGTSVPELQMSLIRLLSKQNAMLREEFTSVVAKHTAESLLAAFILNLIGRNSQYQGTELMLQLPVGRDVIANHLGFRRETLSRIFSKFQQNNWITIKSKKIEILDLAALQNLAFN
jgi:CRP/FNR family transcriptional regulator